MWYLISGRIMAILSFLMLCKLFKTFPDLILFEKIMGWFLIDYILEEYSFTAGKFFLINEDYRSLVRNIVVLISSLCFFAQILTPFEFILVIVFLVIVTLFVTITNKQPKIQLLIILSYTCLFYTFLIVDFFILINLFKFIIVICCLSILTITYLYSWVLSLTYKCYVNKLKQILLLTCLKTIMFAFFLKLETYLSFYLLFRSCRFINNFVLEFVISKFIPYSYFYYI